MGSRHWRRGTDWSRRSATKGSGSLGMDIFFKSQAIWFGYRKRELWDFKDVLGNNKLEHDSIINKTKSQGFTCIISDCSNIKYFFSLEGIGRFIQGSDLVGLWRFWIYYDTGHETLWKTVDWIYNNEIRFEIYDIKARQYWIGELENWNQYKGIWDLLFVVSHCRLL